MTRRGALAGVASLLPDEVAARVVELWDELERDFGIRAARISPLPHFSYQVSREYDLATLQAVVAQIAGGSRALRVRTAGWGVFPGAVPTLHVPIVRSPELAQFHLAVWSAASVAAGKLDQHYHPAFWVPHITLAVGDLTPSLLAQVAESLAARDLSWDFEVDNLAIIRGAGNKPQELVARYELGGVARNF